MSFREPSERPLTDDVSHLLRRRTRTGLWIILGTIAAFAIADVGVAADVRVTAYGLKGAHLLLVLGLLAWLRWPLGATQIFVVALLAVNGTYVLMAAGDVVKGHLATTPMLCVVCNLTAAALLPWGMRGQLFTAAATGAGNLVVLASTGPSFGHLVDPAATVLVTQGVALYVAYELERFRLERVHVESVLSERAQIEAFRADVRLGLGERRGRDEKLQACTDAVVQQLDLARAEVWLGDPPDTTLVRRAASGSTLDPSAGRPALATGLLVRLAAESAPYWTNDLAEETGLAGRGDLRDAGTTALGVVPLIAGGATRGVVVVLGSRPFSPAVRQALHGMSDAVTAALERIAAEEARARLLAQLEEANRVKSEFVSTMSHELRTPLNVIMGYTDMLEDPECPDPAFALARIRHANRELLELIEATLDLNRLESGRDDPQLDEVQLADLWQELACEYAAVSHAARPALEWGPVDGIALRTDRRKLKIILKNLVGNALKFTRQGTVTVAAEQEGTACTIMVHDTGIGIPPDALPHIFEMFRQADSSDRRSYGGVGLGLHIVQRLCVQLGAQVKVASRVGQGSIFTVELPIVGPRAYAA
jgi:signal transduction histidine kinase